MINGLDADIVIFSGGAIRIYEDFMNNCGFHVLNDGIVFSEKFNIEIVGFDNYLLVQIPLFKCMSAAVLV